MTDYHDDHNLAERLWALATGTPNPELEHHIATCRQCQDELAALRSLARYQQTTSGGMAEPPAALRAATTALFHNVRPDLVSGSGTVADRVRDAIQRITAELILDTGLMPQPAGLRATGEGTTRQLAFVSDVADLDIEIAWQGDTGAIVGQLGMDEVPDGLVISFAAVGHDAATVDAAIGDDGRFAVTLPQGSWAASVRLGDVLLQFPEFRL